MDSKKLGIFIVKVFVTGAVVALLFSAVDARAVFAQIGEVPWEVFLYAVFCYLLSVYVSSIRWNMLLRAEKIMLSPSTLLAYNFSYNFYSAALPGGKVAAEAVRLYQVVRDSRDPMIREKIFVPTLLDRSIVVITSGFVAVLFFITVSGMPHIVLPQWLPYAGIGAVFIIGGMAFLPIERLFGSNAPDTAPRRSMLRSFADAFAAYRSRPVVLLNVALLSLLMNALVASGIYAITFSLGLPVSFEMVFALFCVGMVTAFVPFTIAGIGVREGTFAYLLALVSGVPLESAFSVSLIALAAFLSTVAVGGAVEFYRHFIRHIK